MKIDSEQIEYVSKLARLHLNDEEKENFSHQLSDIIEYVEKLNELDLDNVQPVENVEDINNVFRVDQEKPSMAREKLEEVAPQFDNGHVVVPKIINAN